MNNLLFISKLVFLVMMLTGHNVKAFMKFERQNHNKSCDNFSEISNIDISEYAVYSAFKQLGLRSTYVREFRPMRFYFYISDSVYVISCFNDDGQIKGQYVGKEVINYCALIPPYLENDKDLKQYVLCVAENDETYRYLSNPLIAIGVSRLNWWQRLKYDIFGRTEYHY